jgi:hypothetical protein
LRLSGQIVLKNPISKITIVKMARDVAKEVELLLCKHLKSKNMGSTPIPP